MIEEENVVELDGIPHKLLYVSHGNTPLDYRALALRAAVETPRPFKASLVDSEDDDPAGRATP